MFYIRVNTFNVIGKPFLRWHRQLVHRQTWLVSSLGIATVNTLNILMFLFIVALPLHIMAKSSLTVLTHIVVFGVLIVMLSQVLSVWGFKVTARMATLPHCSSVNFHMRNKFTFLFESFAASSLHALVFSYASVVKYKMGS